MQGSDFLREFKVCIGDLEGLMEVSLKVNFQTLLVSHIRARVNSARA